MIAYRSRHRQPTRTRLAATLAAVLAVGVPAVPLRAQPVRAVADSAAAPLALSLEQAMARVADRSESVRIAAAGVTRAQGQLRQARSQFFPQLTGTVNYQRTLQSQFEAIAGSSGGGGDDDGGAEPPPADSGGEGDGIGDIARIFASENTVTLGLQLTQNIYAGGRLAAQARASEAARRAAQIGVTSATAQAQLDVTQAYFDALLAERLVQIAESSLVQTERVFRQTRLARNVGTAAEFDMLRARVTRDNQRPAVLQARTQRDAAFLRLRQLLDIPPTRPLQLTTQLESGAPELVPTTLAVDSLPLPARIDAPVNVDALLAEHATSLEVLRAALAEADTAVDERAPVLQARQNLEAQQQLLRVARGGRLPGISLTSNYQRFAYPISGLPNLDEFFPNWTVSVGLSLPLFTGGRLSGQIEAAEASVAEARAQLQQAEELAALDAELVVAQVENAAAAYAATAGTATQAERAYQIAEVRYREGISTLVELDDSRLLLQQALANRAQAARDLNVARARLVLLTNLPLGAAQSGAGQSPASQRAGASSATQAPGGATPPQTIAPAGPAGGFSQAGQTGGITP
ncbi:MAG TPA: TolC family protein [Gemmatimonadaceae bacterium]|nr:TolC family protein [Gemmatimonadaceae bacterium]